MEYSSFVFAMTSEDAFLTGLASFEENIFTNFSEKTCLSLFLLGIFINTFCGG